MARIAFVDIEASGLGPASYPIEIGLALSTGGPPDARLVRPAAHWTFWDPDAERLHGISRETLLEHGTPLTEVAAWLRDRLDGVPVYLEHAEDFGWLQTLLAVAGSDWRPAMHQAKPLIEAQALRRNHTLAQLRAAVWQRHAAHNPRHRAGPDAAFLRDLYRAACRA